MDRHDSFARRKRLLTTIMVVLVVAASIVVAQRTLTGDDEGAMGDIDAPTNSTDDFGFRLTPTIATGEKTSEPAVTVALYEDFLCPACRTLEERSGTFLREAVASGQIVLEYRPFTFLIGASKNRYTQRASNAAACVADTAGVAAYAEFHDALFDKQPKEGGKGPADKALIALATKAGAPEAGPCIREEEFADWVAQAVIEGRERGVTMTPTVSINDSILRVVGDDGKPAIPRPDDLERAIDQFAG